MKDIKIPSTTAIILALLVLAVGLKVINYLDAKTTFVDRIYQDLQRNYPCSPKE